jgi:mRNA interferase YafQ
MYYLRRSKQFEKSFEKVKRGGLKQSAIETLAYVIDKLRLGEKLEQKYRDHALQGDWKRYRECHIQGDLLLIYIIENDQLVLVLVDIGNHSQLFG